VSSIETLRERLRRFPDDWTDWLVYADWLSEHGDIRGELLAVEHSLWARGSGAESRTSDEFTEALWYADEIATEWLVDHEVNLDDAEVEGATLFLDLGRALLPLASTPDPMRAVLAKRSQVIASLAPRELYPNTPSDSVVVPRDRLIATLIAWISDAFDGAPVPDDDHLTIHQAEAQDNWEGCDRSRDHTGRWQDLPDEHLLANQWGLTHLDEQGVVYYFPATMCHALRHLERAHPDDTWLTESLNYNLRPTTAELRDHDQGRLRLFQTGHRAAIHAFTVAVGDPESKAAWTRVVAGDQHGDNPHWFELYSPPND